MSNSGQPPEKPTVEIEKPPAWAVNLTERVVTGFATTESRFDKTDANIELVATDLKNTKEDLRVTKEAFNLRFNAIEQAPPLTSERVRAVVVEHSSQVDMEAQAREAQRIVKDLERDQQIAETRALVEKAATKEDVKAIVDSTATKAEVEQMLSPTAEKVDRLTATQDVQLAILSRLDKVASNPTVKVIAGMIATALLTWLASHGGSLK